MAGSVGEIASIGKSFAGGARRHISRNRSNPTLLPKKFTNVLWFHGSRARKTPGVEIPELDKRGKSLPGWVCAHLCQAGGAIRCSVDVFHVEYRFLGIQKRRVSRAFLVGEAFLVECPVEIRLQVGNQIHGVFESDGESPRVGGVGQKPVVVQLILTRERKAAVIGIGVDVVGLDGIASACGGTIQAGFHDHAHPRRADVEPVFTRPPVQRPADVGRIEGTGVLTPVLPRTRREIANDFASNYLNTLKNGKTYIFRDEAIDAIKNQLTEENQKIMYQQLKSQFGDFQSLEYAETWVQNNNKSIQIIRLKGNFEKSNKNLEIRVVLNDSNQIAGFWIKPWSDMFK